MQRVIVNGCAGRMGRIITALVIEDSELELAGAVERKGFEEIDAGILAVGKEVGVKVVDDIKKIEDTQNCVIVDFTSPEATGIALEFAKERNVGMVIGTTGLGDRELSKIEEAANFIPIVQSPNMSVGVNLLFKITEIVAKILGDDYDVEIIEAHHRFKKDAPSGTAVKLGQIVAEALGRDYSKVARFGRCGIIGERDRTEIGMQTVRAGDIVGEHTVLFGGIGERIELTHRAHSRETFARGAIRAVKWLKGKGKGLYSMFDVLFGGEYEDSSL